MNKTQPHGLTEWLFTAAVVLGVFALIAWYASTHWTAAAPILGFLVVLAVVGQIVKAIEK